jgi:hypothetical protein
MKAPAKAYPARFEPGSNRRRVTFGLALTAFIGVALSRIQVFGEAE